MSRKDLKNLSAACRTFRDAYKGHVLKKLGFRQADQLEKFLKARLSLVDITTPLFDHQGNPQARPESTLASTSALNLNATESLTLESMTMEEANLSAVILSLWSKKCKSEPNEAFHKPGYAAISLLSNLKKLIILGPLRDISPFIQCTTIWQPQLKVLEMACIQLSPQGFIDILNGCCSLEKLAINGISCLRRGLASLKDMTITTLEMAITLLDHRKLRKLVLYNLEKGRRAEIHNRSIMMLLDMVTQLSSSDTRKL